MRPFSRTALALAALVAAAALGTGCSGRSGTEDAGPNAGTQAERAPDDTVEGRRAVASYRTWVQAQADMLVPAVDRLVSAVASGDVAAAKARYVESRVPWERVEPVAGSFGDLDPRMDLREADLEPGALWTGWHRIEKALWSTGDVAGAVPVARQLAADARELRASVPTARLTLSSIGDGAEELLDEVATGKITGEEEAFSHTDLVDFQANLEGARRAYRTLRPLLDDFRLRSQLDREFTTVQASLDRYRSAAGFVSYAQVGADQRRELARVVDGLSEPLSQLTAALLR
jgi:iron uptake system component EfeO